MSSNPIPDSIEADAQSYLQGRADAEMGIGDYNRMNDKTYWQGHNDAIKDAFLEFRTEDE